MAALRFLYVKTLGLVARRSEFVSMGRFSGARRSIPFEGSRGFRVGADVAHEFAGKISHRRKGLHMRFSKGGFGLLDAPYRPWQRIGGYYLYPKQ